MKGGPQKAEAGPEGPASALGPRKRPRIYAVTPNHRERRSSCQRRLQDIRPLSARDWPVREPLPFGALDGTLHPGPVVQLPGVVPELGGRHVVMPHAEGGSEASGRLRLGL